jgi:hypothetical protein
MKDTLNISASFDQPEFLQDLVERLAARRYESDFISQTIPSKHHSFESSTIETYVSGIIEIDIPVDTETGKERINMPFTTSFLFTCIKGKHKNFKMEWVLSLS